MNKAFDRFLNGMFTKEHDKSGRILDPSEYNPNWSDGKTNFNQKDLAHLFAFIKKRPEHVVLCVCDIEGRLAFYLPEKQIACVQSPTLYEQYPELVFKGDALRKNLSRIIEDFNVELIVTFCENLKDYKRVYSHAGFQVYKPYKSKNL
jgi:hypothetical protein